MSLYIKTHVVYAGPRTVSDKNPVEFGQLTFQGNESMHKIKHPSYLCISNLLNQHDIVGFSRHFPQPSVALTT